MKLELRILSAVLGLGLMLAGCKDDGGGGGGGGGGGELETGYATGKVVDSQGKPISGAKVIVDNSIFFNSGMTGTTDANGKYRIKVEQGAWRVYAQLDRQYNGRTYKVDLNPDNADSFAGVDGAVRNFTWKLSGPKPAPLTGNFGGYVALYRDSNSEISNMAEVEYTFTPVGPLIDGSTGQPITTRCGAPQTAGYSKLEDIPIGRYSITAVHAPPSGPRKPLNIRLQEQGEYASSITTDFEPEQSFCTNCMLIQVLEAQ